jgi:hypothetical protein
VEQARDGHHVVEHRAVREEAGLLDDVADAAARLPGARRAEQREHAAGRHLEREVVDRDGAVVEALRHAVERDHRLTLIRE